MDAVGEWAAAVCAAAVFCAAINIAAPKGAFEKAMKIALAAFALCVLLVPVAGLSECKKTLSDVYVEEYERDGDFERLVLEQSADIAGGSVKRLVERELELMGIASYSVEVITDIEADGSISIGQTTVTAERNGATAYEIRSRLSEKLGIEAEVKLLEDGYEAEGNDW